MSDRALDVITGDFRAAPKGGFESSDNIENMVAFSFMIAAGSWEGDPTLGHRFAELARAIDTVANRNRLGDLARDAVAWIVTLGLIVDVTVVVESWGDGVVAFEVDFYTPGATTPRRAGPFLIPVGAG